MKFAILILLIGLVYLSCANDKKATSETEIITYADTVDIPDRYRQTNFFQQQFVKRVEMMDLPSLLSGYEGLQIRIWFDCGPRDKYHLVQLKQGKGNWEAKFYYYKTRFVSEDSFELVSMNSESKVPKSGWEKFAKELLQTEITDLQDFTLLKSAYSLPMDRDGLAVEVASQNKYRRYDYPELGINKEIKEGPAKLDSAIRLIEKEFKYERPCQQ